MQKAYPTDMSLPAPAPVMLWTTETGRKRSDSFIARLCGMIYGSNKTGRDSFQVIRKPG